MNIKHHHVGWNWILRCVVSVDIQPSAAGGDGSECVPNWVFGSGRAHCFDLVHYPDSVPTQHRTAPLWGARRSAGSRFVLPPRRSVGAVILRGVFNGPWLRSHRLCQEFTRRNRTDDSWFVDASSSPLWLLSPAATNESAPLCHLWTLRASFWSPLSLDQ